MKYGMGQSVTRVEDPRLLTGRGRYVDDFEFPRQAHLYVVRSPHAAADIKKVDASKAKNMPGVILVLTGADADAAQIKGLPPAHWPPPMPEPPFSPYRPLLCSKAVKHVGDPVAVVVAETLAQAKDASEAIEIDYAAKPAIADTAKAAEAGTPKVWSEMESNVWKELQFGDAAAVDRRAQVRRACDQARHLQQPPLHQLDGDALRRGHAAPDAGQVRAVYVEPDPAQGARGADARRVPHPGDEASGHRARRGRRLRAQGRDLRRGSAHHVGGDGDRPPGALVPRPHRGDGVRRPRARPGVEVRDGLRQEQQDRRHAHRQHLQPGRLCVLQRHRHAAARHLHAEPRLRLPGGTRENAHGVLQHGADHALPRRRAAGGQLHGRPADRHRRGGTQGRSGRAAPDQPDPGRPCRIRPSSCTSTTAASSRR